MSQKPGYHSRAHQSPYPRHSPSPVPSPSGGQSRESRYEEETMKERRKRSCRRRGDSSDDSYEAKYSTKSSRTYDIRFENAKKMRRKSPSPPTHENVSRINVPSRSPTSSPMRNSSPNAPWYSKPRNDGRNKMDLPNHTLVSPAREQSQHAYPPYVYPFLQERTSPGNQIRSPPPVGVPQGSFIPPMSGPFPFPPQIYGMHPNHTIPYVSARSTKSFSSPCHPEIPLPPKTVSSTNNSYPYQFPFPFPSPMSHPFFPYMPHQFNPPNPYSLPPFPPPFYSRSQASFTGYPQFTNPPPEARPSRPEDYSTDQSPQRWSGSATSMQPPLPTRSESAHARGDVAPRKRPSLSPQEMRRRARREEDFKRGSFKTPSSDNMASSPTTDTEPPQPPPHVQVSRSSAHVPVSRSSVHVPTVQRAASPSRHRPPPECVTNPECPPTHRISPRLSTSLGPRRRAESNPFGRMVSTRKLHGDDAPLPPPRDPDYWKELEDEKPPSEKKSEEMVSRRVRPKSDANLKPPSPVGKAKYESAERPFCQTPQPSNTCLRRRPSRTEVSPRAALSHHSQVSLDYENAFPEKEYPEKEEPRTPNTVILEKPRFLSPLSEVPERLRPWATKGRDRVCAGASGDAQVEKEPRRRRSRAVLEDHRHHHTAPPPPPPPHSVHNARNPPLSAQRRNGASATTAGHHEQWPRRKRTYDTPQNLPPNVEHNKIAHIGLRQQQRSAGKRESSPMACTPSTAHIPVNTLPPQPQAFGGVPWKQHSNAYGQYSNVYGQVWSPYTGQPCSYPQRVLPPFHVPSQPMFNTSVGVKTSEEAPQRESRILVSPPMRDIAARRHQNNTRQPCHPAGTTPPYLQHRLSDTRTKLAHLLKSSLPSLEEASSSASNRLQPVMKNPPVVTRQARSSAMKSLRSRNRMVTNPVAEETKTSRATSLPSTPTTPTALSRPSMSLTRTVSSTLSRPSTPSTLSSVSALTLTLSQSVARPPLRKTPQPPSVSVKCQRKVSSCCSSKDGRTASVIVTSQMEEKEEQELSVSEMVMPMKGRCVTRSPSSMSGVQQVLLRIVRDKKIVSKYTLPAGALLKEKSDFNNETSHIKKKTPSSKINEKKKELLSGARKRNLGKGQLLGREKHQEFATMNSVSRTFYSSSWSTSYEVHTSESTVAESCCSEIRQEGAPSKKLSQRDSDNHGVTQNGEPLADENHTLAPINEGVSLQAICGDKEECDQEGENGRKSGNDSKDNLKSEELNGVQNSNKRSENTIKDGSGTIKWGNFKVNREKRRIKRNKRKQGKSDDPEKLATAEKQLAIYYAPGEDAGGSRPSSPKSSRKSTRKSGSCCRLTQRRKHRLCHNPLRRRRLLHLMCLCKMPHHLQCLPLYMNTRIGRWDPAGMRFLIDERDTPPTVSGIPPSDPAPRIPTPPEPVSLDPSPSTTQQTNPPSTEEPRIASGQKSKKSPRSSLTWVSPPPGFSRDSSYGQRIEEVLPSCLIVTGLSDKQEETEPLKSHFFAVPALPHGMLGGKGRPKFARLKWCMI